MVKIGGICFLCIIAAECGGIAASNSQTINGQLINHQTI